MGLRSGKDQVTVVLRRNVEGKNGKPVAEVVGRVTTFGRLQEGTADDVTVAGLAGESGEAVLTTRRFICRNFPGDDLSLVRDSAGREYRVLGEPKRHRGSRGTARDAVFLQQINVKRGLSHG